ncbi:MAG: hypothetical protein IBX55_12045 [Methyloprofundus sp.]|nr:hypothetical protein [Methyloprofundus sp.]
MYSSIQPKYINSVGGAAHQSAIDIIAELESDVARLMAVIKDARDCAKSWDATLFGFNEHVEALEVYYAAGKAVGFEYAESFSGEIDE